MLKHLAIIMDGNGRWAEQRGLNRTAGHLKGAETAQRIIEKCIALKIPFLTLYAFSKENWQRPQEEVHFLFELLVKFITKAETTLLKKQVKLRLLGEIEAIPQSARSVLERACKAVPQDCRLTLNLALNYSGRDEIARACRLLVANGVAVEDITSEALANCLYTAGQPDPDLIIRTSGEQRLSNYLLFQSAYSELYFVPTFWPDFTPQDLETALANFNSRNRRFGSLQEKKEKKI